MKETLHAQKHCGMEEDSGKETRTGLWLFIILIYLPLAISSDSSHSYITYYICSILYLKIMYFPSTKVTSRVKVKGIML